MARFFPPITGRWPFADYPELVAHDGVTYRLEQFWTLDEPGVVAQYRAVDCENARHLKVRSDGSFFIDHTDDYNPACGPAHAAGHGIHDTNFGKLLAAFAVGALVIGGAVVVVGAIGAVLDA